MSKNDILFHYRTLNSEQQKRLDQQWNSLTFQPPASQQPSWKTSSTFPVDKKSDHYNTERNTLSSSPFSSKGQYLQGEPFNSNLSAFEKMFSPPQMYNNESKRDLNGISLNDVPLPPKPDFIMQNRDSDNLETFNIKRADPGPVESLRAARPYLASPNEFLSQSRTGQDSGLSNGKVTTCICVNNSLVILGDPGADNRGGRKIKRAKSVRVKVYLTGNFCTIQFTCFIFLPPR